MVGKDVASNIQASRGNCFLSKEEIEVAYEKIKEVA